MNDETTDTDGEVREGSRIAKVMARAGLCSRRDAERWIAEGRVTVNGRTLDSPAYNVSDADDVRVDGERLKAAERTRLFLFHKPRGLVTTARDPEGRATIFDALPKDLPRVVAIGRLDINTEGLLLLSNDGGLARVLELPSTGWLRRYRVRAHGSVDQAQLDTLADGVTIDGVHYAGIAAKLDREQGSNAWITMGLREGKNREIKKVLEHLGLAVNRLIRISFGPFELADLGEGEVAEVRTRVLRDQLGAKLAREAGADFDAPLSEPAPPPPAPVAERQRGRGERPGRSERPSRGDAPRRRSFEPEAASAPARPRNAPSTPERKRKHVSALRAEIAADAAPAAPRKRIERAQTHDRKGRTIAVERVMTAQPTPDAAPRKARKSAGQGERPRRSEPFETKRARDGAGRDRPPRAGGAERGSGGAARTSEAGERRYSRPDGFKSGGRGEGAGKPYAGRAERSPRAEGRGAEGGERRFARSDSFKSGGRGEGAAKPYGTRPERSPHAEGRGAEAGERRYSRPDSFKSGGRGEGAAKPHGARPERSPRAEGRGAEGGERRHSRPDSLKSGGRGEGAAKPRGARPERSPRAEGRGAGAGARRFSRPEGFKSGGRGEGAAGGRPPAKRPPGKGPPRGAGGGSGRPPRKG